MGDQRRSSDECPICLEAFDDHVISLSRGRPFPVGGGRGACSVGLVDIASTSTACYKARLL